MNQVARARGREEKSLANMRSRFASLSPVVLLFVMLFLGPVGCFLAADREIDLDIVYPTPQSSQVTVKYRVPPPPAGKVYVLWILNPDLGKTVKVGQIPAASRLSMVRANVDFYALGAIVSIESGVDVTEMSDTWALKGGQLTPSALITPKPK